MTNDPHIDWNPAWSGDGRQLYFASGRGGTLNLWRVPIDAATGRPGGSPEPVTTPSRRSASFSLSRDGGRLAFEAREERSALYRVAFDPERGRLAGTPELVLGGSRVIDSLGLSPDGEWVAFTSGGLRENIFLVRLDGTGYRQITDDEFRNRGPSWSADGSLIGFYSNRSGRYEVWTLRPDGSGLEPLTETKAGSRGIQSGRSTAAASRSPASRCRVLLDPAKAVRRARRARAAARCPTGPSFHGSELVRRRQAPRGHGRAARRQLGRESGCITSSRGRYEQVATRGESRICWRTAGASSTTTRARFVSWTRRAGARRSCSLSAGRARVNNRQFRVSRDDRQIVFLRTEHEADIWLMSPE